MTRAQEAAQAGQPEKLAKLLAEAERNNPQIQAARHGWDSAKQVPTQASTLPDPQFVLQHVIVGGMITSTIHVLILVPVFFAFMKERALHRGTLHSSSPSGKEEPI